MPSHSRRAQVHPESTPYYHCMSRCVRRAFLMGNDQATGKNFDHRKEWVREELARVCRVFAIDCCAYAVMSNHIHSVVRIDLERAAKWSGREVTKRCKALWPKTVKRLQEQKRWDEVLPAYRERLTSLSWFMREMNERIARRANAEDQVKGRFWEGRFKSRPILDVGGLLTCMAYVDLNPVRAGMAESLHGSDFTSIQDRLFAHGEAVRATADESRAGAPSRSGARAESATSTATATSTDAADAGPSVPLLPFADQARTRSERMRCIPMDFDAYTELVRFTGQAMRDNSATLPAHLGTLLQGIGLNPDAWARVVQRFPHERFAALGEVALLRQRAEQRGLRRAHGVGIAKQLYAA